MLTQLNSEFRPYYTVQNNFMVWHDFAVIKLNYLLESLNKIGLVKRVCSTPSFNTFIIRAFNSKLQSIVAFATV
jgi:hypothetical protein